MIILVITTPPIITPPIIEMAAPERIIGNVEAGDPDVCGICNICGV